MRHWITSFRLLNDAQFRGDLADVKARHQTAGFSLFTRLVHRAPEPFQGQQHHRLGDNGGGVGLKISSRQMRVGRPDPVLAARTALTKHWAI